MKTFRRDWAVFGSAVFLFLFLGTSFASAYEKEKYIFVTGPNSYEQNGIISLASTDEPSVTVGSQNVFEDISLDVYKTDQDALLQFLRHDAKDQQLSPAVKADSLKELGSLKVQKEGKVVLPIEEEGIYLLRLSAEGKVVYSFVVRSRVGVVVKEADNALLFWVQNFQTKRSVSDASIHVYNLEKDVKELQSAVTGKDGTVKTDISEKYDVAVIEAEGSVAVAPINMRYLNYGASYASFLKRVTQSVFFVFTDRPMYQPGDVIHFKTIFREDDDVRYSIPKGSVFVELFSGYDESRVVVFSEKISVSENGSLDGEIVVPKTLSAGDYTLGLYIGESARKEQYPSASLNIPIEFFQKPEYGLDMSLSSGNEVISGDAIVFDLEGKYFSGQPVSGAQVTYTIVRSDIGDVYYQNTEDIDAYQYGYYYGKEVSSNTVILDENGKAQVSLVASAEEGKSVVYGIEATLKTESGQQVVEKKNVLVRAGEFGMYRNDFAYGGLVGQTQSVGIALKAFRDISLKDRTISVSEKITWWDRKVRPDGKYTYEKSEENPDSWTIQTNEKGEAQLSFVSKRSGSYLFTLSGRDDRGNLVVQEIHFWASDKGMYAYTSDSGSGLQIKPDRSQYIPGGKAKFVLSSDVADRDVLVTFDREYAHRYRVVSISGNEATFEEILSEEDVPNIFVTASSFSASNLETINENISVSAEVHRLNVAVSAKKPNVGPGEMAEVTVQTKDSKGNPVSAEVTLWAVDKAIFELADPNSNDIFKTFWRERYFGTEYAHSLMGIGILTAEMGGCFSGETRVLMEGGMEKNIQDVSVGDFVLTRESESDPALVSARVASLHHQESDGYFTINDSLKVTGNHIVWVNNTWKRADAVRKGDVFRGESGEDIVVEKLEWRQEKISVYNLEVENKHSYFANGVWVHNGKGGTRSIFKDTAYWNPTLTTGKDGKATVSFRLPDNLTTWVISAVASTKDTSVGQATSEIVVNKDVIIRPQLPRVLYVGDSLFLTALVQNFTGKDQTFSINLQFDGGEVSNANQDVLIGDGKDALVTWQVNPKTVNETAHMIFSAVSSAGASFKDGADLVIPVRMPGYWETHSFTGNASKEYVVDLPKDVDIQKSSAKIEIASTLSGTIPSAMEYLVDYPYGCIEQTTSRFVPAVIAKEHPDLYTKYIQGKNLDDMIRVGVDRISRMQNDDGGWGWWGGKSDPFISAYVVEYVLRAEKTGVEIPQDMIWNAKRYFGNEKVIQEESEMFLSTHPTRPEEKKARYEERLVMFNYGRSLLGLESAPIGFFSSLVRPDAIAYAVMTNLRNGITDPELNKKNYLLSLAKKEGSVLYWDAGSGRYFGSFETSTALAFRALMASGTDSDTLAKIARYLSENRKQVYWGSTFATAQTIDALSQYTLITSPDQKNQGYILSLDGKTLATGILDKQNGSDEITLPIGDIVGKTSSLKLSGSTSDAPLFSTLSLKEFRIGVNKGEDGQGIRISRTYENAKGKEYGIGAGDTVNVTLLVEGLTEGTQYLSVEDQLPSGFVPINTDLKNEQTFSAIKRDQEDFYWNEQREFTKNGVVFSVESINNATQKFTYQARAVVSGSFTTPPAVAFLMYRPEVYGRTSFTPILVSKEAGTPTILSQIKTSSVVGVGKLVVLGALAVIAIFFAFMSFRNLQPLLHKSWESWKARRDSTKNDPSL